MRLWLLILVPFAASAHMVSVSTGEARVDGNRVYYDLRMPLFEAQHLAHRENLLDSIRFDGAARLNGQCREDSSDGSFRCSAVYEYPAPPDRLTVECLFHQITVPNHMHVFRAVRGDKSDQAVFELSSTKATLRFEPPTALETAVTRSFSGFARAVASPAPLLFLFALALAARTRRELAALLGMFFAGQLVIAALFPRLPWSPSPRFIEAAAALAVAYLAVEVILLPTAGQRWLVVGILGLVHGLAFAAFLRSSGESPGWFLAGAFAGQLLLAVAFTALLGLLTRPRLPAWAMRAPAVLLLAAGLGWFAWLLA